MANKEVDQNKEIEEKDAKAPETGEQTGEQIALVPAETPKKKMGTGLKVAIGVGVAALASAVVFGVKCLIEAISGGDDEDTDPAEEESPTEE